MLVDRNTKASLENFAAKSHLKCGYGLSEKHGVIIQRSSPVST